MPSSTQRRFEGRSLEDLLEQVRSELGPGAAIVEANKLRTGGLAGFFSKERFEVVVDVETPDPAGPAPAVPALEPAPAPPASAPPAPASILDLADRVSDVAPPSVVDAPPAAPQAPFASVLRRVAADVAFELQMPPTIEAPANVVASTPVEVADPTKNEEAGAQMVVAPAPMPVPAPVAEPGSSPLPSQALAEIGLPPHLVPRTAAEPDVARTLLTTLERLPLPDPLPDVPGTVLAVVGPRSEALALARRFASDLGNDPSSVFLVSENFKGVTNVPAEQRLSGAEAVAEQRRAWRRRRQPTVVAVEAAPGHVAGAWARAVLDAMEPTSVWATVHACRKPEDVVAWAEALGGVDALAVTNLEDTVSPAAVLQVGIPVGRLDGRPASPALWAALLTERIAA